METGDLDLVDQGLGQVDGLAHLLDIEAELPALSGLPEESAPKGDSLSAEVEGGAGSGWRGSGEGESGQEDGRGARTPEGEDVGVVVNDEDGERRLSGSRVVTGQREWRLGGGGDGEGEINKTAGILRAEEGHAINESAVEGDAVVDVLVGVLEEADSDRAPCPSVGGVLEGTLMVEAEEMRSDVGSEDGAEVAPAEGVVTDNEGIGDAGVEEGAKSNPVPAKEGKAVATATVDDLDYGGVRKPESKRRVKAVKKRGDASYVKDMGVAVSLGEGDRAVGGHGGVDAQLDELHSPAEAELALEVEGDETGVPRLREDSVQMSQGGEGRLLELVVGWAVGGGVDAGRRLLVKGVKRSAGGGEEGERERSGEH